MRLTEVRPRWRKDYVWQLELMTFGLKKCEYRMVNRMRLLMRIKNGKRKNVQG